MKTLPNGVVVFNATPHIIRFWAPGWEEPVEIGTDEVINAYPHERIVDERDGIIFVRTDFIGDSHGRLIAEDAFLKGATIVVGSIIAAQCYQGVVAMIPCEGYERVPPAEKRMRPDRFTTFF